MDYNKIAKKGLIQESSKQIKLQEDKYCESVINMLLIMDESEQVEYIKNMPQHLREATLKKQAKKMTISFEDLSKDLENLEKAIIKDNNILETKKNDFMAKINSMKKKVVESLEILHNKDFQDWYLSVDSNSGLFGFAKAGSTGPSRRSLGL